MRMPTSPASFALWLGAAAPPKRTIQFETLAHLLARRGYPEGRIDNMLGLDFCALAREAWG
jgi:hypothetical protein